MIVAEDMELGVEPTPGLGSRPTPFAEAREQVREALQAGVDECEANGVRAVSPLNVILRELLYLDDPLPYAEAVAGIADAGERARVLAALPHDFHAGFFETSLTLHYAPASVSPRYRDLPDSPPPTPVPAIVLASKAAKAAGRAELARELAFAAIGRGWLGAKPFLGYTSAPRYASPEAGAVFARVIVERYLPVIEDVLDGKSKSPPPILRWTTWVGAH
jgi:creatinine amidohydrolase